MAPITRNVYAPKPNIIPDDEPIISAATETISGVKLVEYVALTKRKASGRYIIRSKTSSTSTAFRDDLYWLYKLNIYLSVRI
jgi:hypothetical protein